ncbi:ATP-binding cassette transporter yor1 [Lecanora helva]
MSTDTARIDQAAGSIHLVWTSPIAILVALTLLIFNLTYSALAGFAVLVIGLMSVTHAVKSLGHRRTVINGITDKRISQTREMLHAIRSVKLFGWENAFARRLEDLRAKEVRSIRILLTTRSAIGAVSMAMPIFSQMIAFITYSYTVTNMDPAATFSSLALFQSLRTPLNWIPLAIGHAMDARASLRRIEEFLLAEEAIDEAVHDPASAAAVELKGAGFTWERSAQTSRLSLQSSGSSSSIIANREIGPNVEQQQVGPMDNTSTHEKLNAMVSMSRAQDPFMLRDLNIAIGRHELIGLIGNVGSGKSSLLAAIAGDMRKTTGEMVIGSSRAYCPQYSWIQNASVRENVIFGTSFNSTRYRSPQSVNFAVTDNLSYEETIRACALAEDINSLPHGDMTEIGERGVTLSGGQKQRINIARAIYVDRDIVLMDDPLSAVDAHVGQHIFEHAIRGMLSSKCRILATHQLHVLSSCDRVVCMNNGRIETIDSYNNLIKRDNQLGRFLLEKQSTYADDEAKFGNVEKSGETDHRENCDEIKTTGKTETLMQDEGDTLSSISWRVYAAYNRASGSVLNVFWILILLVLFRASNLMVNLWLAYWVSDDFPLKREHVSMMGTHASKTLLNNAIQKVLRAPMSFFDTTPLGRILHRLSKDTDVMDNNLTDAIRMFTVVLSLVVASFILIIVYFYYFVVALVPLCILLLSSAAYYRASARALKRHQAIRDAHVFAKFSEALSGSACIRAYGLQARFTAQIQNAIDEMNGAYFLTFSNQRWLGIRLDGVGIGLVFATGILVVVDRFHISPSISGLVLSYILQIIELLQYIVRQQAEVENAMNGTERLHQYSTSLESEAPLELASPPSSWPPNGSIDFENVELRYRPELPLVLKSLTLSIHGGEVMGIVGRTGAGKSSIATALFRLSEISGGRITIDGVDISKLGLHTLRKALSIVPQDPVLFAGTIRSNLDPFAQHDDHDLHVALQLTRLVDSDSGSNDDPEKRANIPRVTLDSVVQEDGSNFSLGQRQLIAFARALIRGGKVLIIDEGTSAEACMILKMETLTNNLITNDTSIIPEAATTVVKDQHYKLIDYFYADLTDEIPTPANGNFQSHPTASTPFTNIAGGHWLLGLAIGSVVAPSILGTSTGTVPIDNGFLPDPTVRGLLLGNLVTDSALPSSSSIVTTLPRAQIG